MLTKKGLRFAVHQTCLDYAESEYKPWGTLVEGRELKHIGVNVDFFIKELLATKILPIDWSFINVVLRIIRIHDHHFVHYENLNNLLV